MSVPPKSALRVLCAAIFGVAIAQLLRGGAAARADDVVRIDLGEDWTPRALAAPPEGPAPDYRATYLALAQERFADAGSDGELARRDRYLELFGIEPTFAVVRARLADDARHACHDAVDDAALARWTEPLRAESRDAGLQRVAAARRLRAELERVRARRKLPDLAALAATGPARERQVARLAALEDRVAAVRAVQTHLACDGLLVDRPVEGAYTWPTASAVRTFQRGAMILPSGVLDRATIDAFVEDSRERDFRTVLRVLRERVADAAGLIEDGSAGNAVGTVLGRSLEPADTWRVRGHEALPGAAPDRLSAATELAALALGWRDPASARAALARPHPRFVEVRLPERTAWQGISFEIDRGDVWIDHAPRARTAERRPAVIVYATDGRRRVPLARYPTTIGGWQYELVGDEIEQRFKDSPVGPRMLRDLYVGPRWLPPDTTPDRELVRASGGGYVLAREQLGPSYRAAFGMVAFVHFREDRERGGVVLVDEGIRTHGTGSLISIASGASHGCHRLLGVHAVRLAGFVLARHPHVRRGATPTTYRRVVRHHGSFPIAIDTQGYRFELVPPIPVDVLPGRIHRR